MFIRIVDVETTSESPEDGGICEIGYCDIALEKRDLAGDPAEWTVGEPQAMLTDPGCPITPITSAIHHIIDADIMDARPWRKVLTKVMAMPCADGDTDMVAWAAHSAKFEKLWFDAAGVCSGLPYLCTYKLALRLWPDAPSHSNMALRYWRTPPGLVRATALPAHRAGPDAYVTAFHLRDLLEEAAQKDAGHLIERAAKISTMPALQVICHIGTWRGKKWEEVDEGFLHWLLGKDFDEDVMFTANYWLKRHEQEWNETSGIPHNEGDK